jgi:ketosteroid isomerase-like protein
LIHLWIASVIRSLSCLYFDPQSGQASTGLKPPSTHFEKRTIDFAELVKGIYLAYETKDKSACENLLTDDFTFTSPNDDHASKQDYLQRCWPFSEENQVYQLEQIIVGGNQVFVLYACETKAHKKFKNTEHFLFENAKIKSIEVFFGGGAW